MMTVVDSTVGQLDTPYVVLRRRCKLLRRHLSCPVEMLAGPNDLTADRGILGLQRSGNLGDPPTVTVEFEKNGTWAIPVDLLFIPGVDSIRQLTDAFIVCGPQSRERELHSVSFQLACHEDAERHHQYDAQERGNSTEATQIELIECACNRFGNCPECREQYNANGGGYVNVGRVHWGYCEVHKTKWRIGENLFSCWHGETEEDWQRSREMLDTAIEVKPWHCDECLTQMQQHQSASANPTDFRAGSFP